MALRHLTPDDLPAIHRLEAELYEPALRVSDEAFLGLLTLFPDGAFGVCEGPELCAFGFAVPLPAGTVLDLQQPLERLPPGADTFYIHNVGVAAPYRGRGLARQLVGALLDVARARGLRACELVSVQGSAPFWETFGFAKVAAFSYAPGAAATHMRAVLPNVRSLQAMSILVTGGTGTVGSAVVKALLERGETVKVLTRDPAKLKETRGVTAVQGNLLEPSTARHAFDGVDRVFLISPVSQTEASEALMAITGMRSAKVARVVYLSVHDVQTAAWLPHFGAKIGVEEGLKRSGLPFTILRPNNFYQNDYWFKDVLLQYGVYPQPLGSAGVSRVDVRDIAEAAAIALTAGGHEGQTYDLVGPEAVTGESTAKSWSQALGKPIAYGGDDLDAWETQQLQYLPAWMVFDFRYMYEHFQAHGLIASAEAIARQTTLLGHAPRGFDAFAKETAAAWR